MIKSELLNALDNALHEFEAAVLDKARDDFERKSFSTIKLILDEMKKSLDKDSCQAHQYPEGYIARLVVESDPRLLQPELGGRLIEIERSYFSIIA